ncbi:MAG: hypothetical protein N2205_07680 [Candidatus Caldatribacterium sp.]|uniref:hypothetical protein n=1 Tax=Candidatus Caldatribacterium sp. TaxID=2282143 RepID=UPI002992B658|nr:hypothetical protein [Candidatus Caldatribacterium sp.]MCX7731074.1 hypothetical protein [Candidatus Caldatribacterium sp.]MDW8081276.1 hypothetical protein [Candidatus Calescibacterium sp.]
MKYNPKTLYGAIGIAISLGLLNTWRYCPHPEVRFFLLRALSVRYLPDPAEGILLTHPPLPLLFALSFREHFPLITGWTATFFLFLVGMRQGNALPLLCVLSSPAFLLGALSRPALVLFSLFAAFGFSAILVGAQEKGYEKLPLGNLVFGFGACVHPLGFWLLPLFVLCEVLAFPMSLPRRGTLAVIASLPFLILQSMGLFFGWVYEGYALSPFRNPERSLGTFLQSWVVPPHAADTNILLALPILLVSPFLGLRHAIPLWGILALSLFVPRLTAPYASLLPALLLALRPEPKEVTFSGLLAWNALGWALVLFGFFPC